MKKTMIALATFGAAVMAQATEPQIGVSIYSYGDNFMSLMKKELEKQSQAHGLSLLMNDAQNSQTFQNEQVSTLLNKKKVSLLMINLVDPAAYVTVAGKAKNANTPVIFFNKDPGMRALREFDNAYYVGAITPEAGKMQAELIAKHWKANPSYDLNNDGKLQYALLKGDAGHPDAEIRTKVVIQTLEEMGISTEAVEFDSAKWQNSLAREKTAEWLKGENRNNIEVIIANNDAMALGALAAVKGAGKKLPIYGVDALPEALQKVKTGELAGTVYNDAKNQIQAMVSLAEQITSGKLSTEGTSSEPSSRIVRMPYIAIDKDNLRGFLK